MSTTSRLAGLSMVVASSTSFIGRATTTRTTPVGRWEPLSLGRLDPSVRAARKLLHSDFKERWLEDMPVSQRMESDVATLLDPRFKTYTFPGCGQRRSEDVLFRLDCSMRLSRTSASM